MKKLKPKPDRRGASDRRAIPRNGRRVVDHQKNEERGGHSSRVIDHSLLKKKQE